MLSLSLRLASSTSSSCGLLARSTGRSGTNYAFYDWVGYDMSGDMLAYPFYPVIRVWGNFRILFWVLWGWGPYPDPLLDELFVHYAPLLCYPGFQQDGLPYSKAAPRAHLLLSILFLRKAPASHAQNATYRFIGEARVHQGTPDRLSSDTPSPSGFSSESRPFEEEWRNSHDSHSSPNRSGVYKVACAC